MKTYLSIYLGSALLSLAVTPAVIWLALRMKAVDRPGVRTVHTRPIPRIGGVAIFLSAVSMIVAALFLDNAIGHAFQHVRLQVVTLLCSASVVFLVGLVDDLRGLPARVKFIVELLAAGSLCLVGVRISSIAVTNGWSLHLGFMSWPLTILWNSRRWPFLRNKRRFQYLGNDRNPRNRRYRILWLRLPQTGLIA